jgi:hypothetical protein
MTLRNRHPADELADVRAEIRELKAREDELRDILLDEKADRVGVQFKAVVTDWDRQRFDHEAASCHFGWEALAPFYRKTTFKTVKLKPTK